ncbi:MULTISPECIES: hypothetical protein [unclassified Aureispira]|uniref:hypothetical protein n=1 Tax=unclassified Aureispira TaxID=2649989 RepID=UPI0006976FD6|nr:MULTISPECIES: hypothetical protein [unclassified Aureispira]WMX16179.1 hypothetical protein QP953_07360 [Aureispira sp. CCB-E]
MKSTTLLFSLFLCLTLFACGSSTDGGDANTTTTPKVEALSCSDLTSQYEEKEGKEITIKAISWGTSNTATGDIYLNLGDEPLTGMKQAKVVAVFPADKEEEAKSIAKDTEVTLTATVGESKYGAIYLTNPIVK